MGRRNPQRQFLQGEQLRKIYNENLASNIDDFTLYFLLCSKVASKLCNY